jgi:hypothetical protein
VIGTPFVRAISAAIPAVKEMSVSPLCAYSFA